MQSILALSLPKSNPQHGLVCRGDCGEYEEHVMQKDSIRLQIAHVEAEISELTARLPRHSTPPAMLLRLEELEETLALLREQSGATPEAGIA